MKTLSIVIIVYLLLLWDHTVTYSGKRYEYKLQYYGLVWVALDYWSIKKYRSNDKPMRWISFTRTKKSVTSNKFYHETDPHRNWLN